MRVRICIVSAVVLLAGGLAGTAGPAAADGSSVARADSARSITVADPEGDVIDVGDAETVRKGRSVDITRAVYRIERGQVRFAVENRRVLRGQDKIRLCDQQLLTVQFTSGAREYRATAGARFDLVSRVGSGPWQSAGSSYGGGCGGGSGPNESSFEFSAPTSTFRAGTITDIRTTLRVKGSRARDVVATSTGTLRFDPRR